MERVLCAIDNNSRRRAANYDNEIQETEDTKTISWAKLPHTGKVLYDKIIRYTQTQNAIEFAFWAHDYDNCMIY